jgi:hypothetical protein
MDAVFKKLNYKTQTCIHVLNAPASFASNTNAMQAYTTLKTNVTKKDTITFFIGFVTKQKEVVDMAKKVIPQLAEDAVFWMCYPKGTSKKYTCDFNRDTGWQIIGQHEMEPVRMVAIDEDWSALRFRKVVHIKKMTRNTNMILSKSGMAKSSKKAQK